MAARHSRYAQLQRRHTAPPPAIIYVMVSRAATARQSPPVPASLTRDQLLEIYRYLRLTRSLEERLTALYRQSKVIGGLFRSLGQEGESVATAYALTRGRNQDILSPLIRNLGSMLVMGAAPIAILRQYMAKAESPTRGRELNVHFNDLEQGYLDRKSTRLNSSHSSISYAVFCLKKKKNTKITLMSLPPPHQTMNVPPLSGNRC